jgi:hypothetical protein
MGDVGIGSMKHFRMASPQSRAGVAVVAMLAGALVGLATGLGLVSAALWKIGSFILEWEDV